MADKVIKEKTIEKKLVDISYPDGSTEKKRIKIQKTFYEDGSNDVAIKVPQLRTKAKKE
jgi:hypothetical protein